MNNDQNNNRQNENNDQDQYYNPNGQYYNPNGQYYNPNHNNGGQFNPDSFFNPYQNNDSCGKTAQTFGIVSLVCIFFCQILAIVFGALAMSNAKKSVLLRGYECPEAKSGRVMGLIGLIAGIGQMLLTFLLYALIFIGVLSADWLLY